MKLTFLKSLCILSCFLAMPFSFGVGAGVLIAENTTLRFAVTDISGLEELQRDFHAFEKQLTEYSGVALKLYPLSNRNVVVEAMRRGQIDLVLAGPAEYVVIKKRVGAVPVVSLVRDSYRSAIIVRSESPAKRILDLKGQKIAFGDIGSTSYHLAPMQILKEAGLDPQKDIQALHVNKHVAWKALVRGDVAALGFNLDRYKFFLTKDTHVDAKDLRVLQEGKDLPGDVLLASEKVSQQLISKIRAAFVDHGESLLATMLKSERNQKYAGMSFKAAVQDADYDYIRTLYATAGFPEYSEFLGSS